MLRNQARRFAAGLSLVLLAALGGCSSFTPAKIPFVTTNGEIDAQIAMARVAEQSNDNDRAKEIYEEVLKKRPKNATAYHRLGVIAAREERPEKADEYFVKARQFAPNDPEVLADIGYQHYMQHRLPEAEEVLRASIEIDHQHQRSLNNLGLVLGQQGRFDEALAQFRRGGSDAEAYANLAFVLAYHGRFEEAKKNYSLALTKNPGLKVAAEALVELNKVVPDVKPNMQQGMVAGMPGAPWMSATPGKFGPQPVGVAPVGAVQPMGPGAPGMSAPAQPVPFHQPLGAPAMPGVAYPNAAMPAAAPVNVVTPTAAFLPEGVPAATSPYPMTPPTAPEMIPMAPPSSAAAPTNMTPLPPVAAG